VTSDIVATSESFTMDSRVSGFAAAMFVVSSCESVVRDSSRRLQPV
jgi:hypothetical protein